MNSKLKKIFVIFIVIISIFIMSVIQHNLQKQSFVKQKPSINRTDSLFYSIKINSKWIIKYNEDNPFEPTKVETIVIIDKKDNYILYEFFNDTTSSKVNIIELFEEVK